MTTKRKSYQQICPISTALDVIGDRWTILILRELLGGSARFSEIRDGLPGIAANLLTERLQRLEEDGLVRQIKMHKSMVYALTEQGESVRYILEELGFWGSQLTRVAPIKYGRSIRAIAMALQSILVRAGDALPTEQYVVELETDEGVIEIILSQSPTVTVRPAHDPDARVQSSTEAMAAVLRGELDQSDFTLISGSEIALNYFIEAIQ